MQRWLIGVLVVALVAAAAIVTVNVVGVPFRRDDRASIAVRWAALGDSYSSGLGEIDRPQGCARDVRASYVGQAVELLRSKGYKVALRFVACSGATLDHLLVAPTSESLAQLESVDATVNLVTLTFGGDDVGFGSVVSSCLASHFAGRLSAVLGVDTRISECAVDADNPTNRGGGEDGWKGIEDELLATLRTLLGRMSPTGQVFVLSYPLVFADPAGWPTVSCFGFTADNAHAFNLGVVRMGEAMRNAIARANDDPVRVRFVDWREQTSERNVWADHGLCGKESPWVHGVRAFEPGGLSASLANSFHPTVAGYAHAADLLSKAIEATTNK